MVNNLPENSPEGKLFHSIFSEKHYFVSPLQVLIWNKNEDLAEKILRVAEEEKVSIFKLDEKSQDIYHTAFVIRKYASTQFYSKWVHYLKTLLHGDNKVDILKAVIGHYHAIDTEGDENKLNSMVPKLPKEK
jgi:prenyltransferase beta subunit